MLHFLDSYQNWRDAKLLGYPSNINALIVELSSSGLPSLSERKEIKRLCHKANIVIYSVPSSHKVTKDWIRSFANSFGLKTLDRNMFAASDSISTITDVTFNHVSNSSYRYIPYTNRAITWHTDGYYNPLTRHIRSFILHCDTTAAVGGINLLLDPEILYIRLYEESPDLTTALSHTDSMTIPANIESARSSQVGPVFFSDPVDRNLCMRYTHRSENVEWHREIISAVTRLKSILDEKDVPYIFQHRLEPGQGLICNNVLHTRTAFQDSIHSKRLLYRARFLERVSQELQ